MKNTKGTPPINFLLLLLNGKCPHCKESKIEFYDEGRTPKESAELRRLNKVKPLWECSLRPNIRGHISCTLSNWNGCPLH